MFPVHTGHWKRFVNKPCSEVVTSLGKRAPESDLPQAKHFKPVSGKVEGLATSPQVMLTGFTKTESSALLQVRAVHLRAGGSKTKSGHTI